MLAVTTTSGIACGITAALILLWLTRRLWLGLAADWLQSTADR